MFDGILSPAAAQLYQRLLKGDKVHIVTGQEHDPQIEGSPAHELVTSGFAAASDRGVSKLVITEPGAAQAAALRKLLAEIESRHRNVIALVDGFRTVQHRYRSSNHSESEILTDPNEIILLSRRLVQTARVEVLSFVTESMEDPAKIRVAMPISVELETTPTLAKTIYSAAFLSAFEPLISTSVDAGEQARIVQDLPHKMIIVDREKALVAMNETGLGAALLTSSRQIIDGLTMLFDFVWERAIPHPVGDESDDLTPIEKRALTLLATGSKDEAIANKLNVTVRTVRRHITSAMNKLGAENRFAAGVLASRRGWI